MSGVGTLELAAAAFVGSHFILSHPLRKPLVRAMGEKAFLAVYSLVAFATLGWMIWAAMRIGPEVPNWTVGTAGFVVASLLVWLGAILFVGSFKGNPALPHPDEAMKPVGAPRGVFRITRHPMMWGFGLWGIAHVIVNPTPSGLIISEAIIVLALIGAMLQDVKKEELYGEPWRQWQQATSFVPFGRGLAMPDATALVGGTILFLLGTWAHGALGYRPAGPWVFLG